jgi:HSP20 family protein|tara:strand:+ start:263 stop:646 length:384 start_codon:yes stop_codon:yes gene_type:complete
MFDNHNGYPREPDAYETANWTPRVDIREDDMAFTVSADLPGVNPDEVKVTLHNGVLTIKGEKSSEKETEKAGYRRCERTHGSFFRQFTLPESTSEGSVKAKAVNGVLEICIPKAEKPKPLSITVAVE